MSGTLMNNASGGTNSTTVTTDNCGAQSGEGWDYIYLGGGLSMLRFTNSPARGGMAYHWTIGPSASTGYMEWSKLPESTTVYVRFYVYMPTAPSTSTRLCEINDASVKVFSIGIRTDGKLSLRDSADTQMGISTTPIPLGRWVRIEAQCTSSATNGSAVVRLYTEADSPYPAEKLTMTGTYNTRPNGTGIIAARFGMTGLPVANWTCYYDDLTFTNTTWPGPADPAYAPSLLRSNNAEMGTNGVAATIDGTGDNTNTYFQDVKTSAMISFSNAQKSHGSLSYLFQPTSGNDCTMTWMDLVATSGALRVYAYFPAFPTATMEFAQFTTSTSGTFAQLSRFGLTPSGKLQLQDSAGTVLWMSTNTLAVNTWYRLEQEIILGGTATSGTINAAYYILDNTTAVETFSTSSANLGTAPLGWARFGKINMPPDITSFYMDGFAVRQLGSGFIGPYSGPPAPFVPYGGVLPHLGWGRCI